MYIRALCPYIGLNETTLTAQKADVFSSTNDHDTNLLLPLDLETERELGRIKK